MPDYLSNSVYIGLANNKEIELYTYCVPAHLLKGIGWNHPIVTNALYPPSWGPPGFFVSGKVENPPWIEEPEIIIRNIWDKVYDKIVFGSIHRDRTYWWDATENYKREDIIVLDGDDYGFIAEFALDKSIYFKREITLYNEKIKPISFGIPDQLLLDEIPEKEQYFGTVVPGLTSTYIFDNEEEYFKDYQKSYFGITEKKGGWDCLRHYEILANRSIPYFKNIETCPRFSLYNFPKEIISYTNQYSSKKELPPDYKEINLELYNYSKEHLVCSNYVKQLFL